MNTVAQRPKGGLRFREYKDVFNAEVLGVGLPVVEHHVTQVGSGVLRNDGVFLTAPDVALMRLRITTLSVGVTVLDTSHTCFLIPIRWGGEYRVNGEVVSSSTFFMPCSSNALHSRSEGRELLATILKESQFIETVAALRGIGPEDVNLQGGTHSMTDESLSELRQRLGAILNKNRNEHQQHHSSVRAEEFCKQVLQMAADAYLFSTSESETKPLGFLQSNRIFRKAEECFEAAGQVRISLADLCSTAGVSKSSLYQAFHNVCGEPPITYFYKRRMMKARSILIGSPYEPGVITRTAVSAGFTEIGRFSVEYRRMFGESPSVTLTKSSLSRGVRKRAL